MKEYMGMVSSDWSQCLSPSGPFDAFVFHFPHIEMDFQHIFRSYTANEISLGHAVDLVKGILPAMLTPDQMDDYLKACFETYQGVGDLIRWCSDHQILFMINTTGFMGYFQRILAKALLPPFPALSAQSMLRFSCGGVDPEQMIDLFEIEDKVSNTAHIAELYNISTEKIVLMGDSGGDGPHFEWGASTGATLIGSMTKPSLRHYCCDKGILIHHHFGHRYAEGEEISSQKENEFDFLELTSVIEQVVGINL